MAKTSKNIQEKTFTVDAAGLSLGRLGVRLARILQGKDSPAYQPYIFANRKVKVVNLDRVKFTGKKLSQKTFYRHTGYIGH